MELGKIPPHDIEAEQAVIGSMLTDSDAVMAAVEKLREDSFYREDNKLIFEAIVNLYNRSEPVDLVTVKDELSSMGNFEKVGGAAGPDGTGLCVENIPLCLGQIGDLAAGGDGGPLVEVGGDGIGVIGQGEDGAAHGNAETVHMVGSQAQHALCVAGRGLQNFNSRRLCGKEIGGKLRLGALQIGHSNSSFKKIRNAVGRAYAC